ncbi:MAG: Hsp70 family protein, partial [Pirellulales bacterium]|nr:Hsp70 family protein [Pirellulales bacterium]
NISLANFNLVGIPPAPRGMSQIEVSFEVDADGILHVSAKDLGTGKKQEIQVETSGGLSESQINEIIEESGKSAEVDQKRKDLALLKNEAEGLLYSVRKTLDSYGDKIGDELKESIEKSVGLTNKALEGEDYNELKESLDGLKSASYKFADVIYSKQRSAGEQEVQDVETEKE